MGVSEHIGVRVQVFREDGDPLTFGLSREGFPGGAVPEGFGGTDLISAAWSRQIGQGPAGAAGRLTFALPGREEGAVGLPWSELISPCDYVELSVAVHRYPDPGGDWSADWRVDWTGFVEDAGFDVVTLEGGQEISLISCSDQMGTLDYEQYAYWRNVGAVFAGAGSEAATDILSRAEEQGYSEMDFSANSVAGAAELLFKVMLYERLGFSREVRGEDRLWEDLHGYRFESDDFAINIDLQALAPEASSWMEAVSWAVDAPSFYEFFLDNVDARTQERGLRGVGEELGTVTQTRTKRSPTELPGGRAEVFVIRPVPFPSYDPERGGYRSDAWDALPTIEAPAYGTVSVKTGRTRKNIYSTFSVDIVNQPLANADSQNTGGAEAVVVGDAQAYFRRVGYRPLDVSTKRYENILKRGGAPGEVKEALPRQEFARRLAWQLFSLNHFNDRFYSGEIATPLDLRPRLGTRYLCEGMLYYVEGYQHSVDTEGSMTTLSVSRGLTAAQYGFTGGLYPQHRLGPESQGPRFEGERDLFPKYLGRQRPGEKHAPVSGDALVAAFVDDLGARDD